MADTFALDDLEEFMEVVMSYRCKFCQFMSNSTQEMAYHVHNTHQTNKQDKSKNQKAETTSLPNSNIAQTSIPPNSNNAQTYVYTSDSILQDSSDVSTAINSLDCVTVKTENGEVVEVVDMNETSEQTDMDVTDNFETGPEILPHHSTSEPCTQSEVNTLLNQLSPPSNVIILTSDSQISTQSEHVILSNQMGSQTPGIVLTTESQTGSQTPGIVLTTESQTGSQSDNTASTNQISSQPQVITMASESQTGPQLSDEFTVAGTNETVTQSEILTIVPATETGTVLNEANTMSEIQFINQDTNGQYILQDGENVQFDNGSTVQVLIHNAEYETQGDAVEDVGEALGEHVVEKASEVQVVESEDNLPYIIKEVDMYGEVSEKDDCADTDTADSQTECGGEEMNDDKPPEQAELLIEGNENEANNQSEMELFLCGNCRQGFSTIQECKAHMTQEHGLSDAGTQSKVDAGTQMEPRKKAGRKKKSEIPPVKEEVEADDEGLVLSDSDEDWSKNKEMYSFSKRSQRRRKPPESLRNDYYLGRSKKKMTKKREDPGMNIECMLKGCNAKFREEETFKKHLECHIEGAKSTEHQFKCLMCEERFFFWKLARYHMWKVHKLNMDLLSCPTCQVFKTDTMSKLKVHCEIHRSERPYACKFCGKAFKQLAQMKNHEALHEEYKLENARNGDTDKWHMPKTCDICERTFANAKCLKKHQEVLHAQIKPFKCRYCDHECSRKAMLVLHERTHTGEKPFKCDLCHYSCGDHNSLRRHKMRHTGQKPYKCPHCPYACIQAISFKVHIKNKHPGMGGIYNCSMCLYRTVNMQQFENHQKDHKNGLIEKTVENADFQATQKTTAKQRKSRSLLDKPPVMMSLPQSVFSSNFQTQNVLMHNMAALPQIVQIPASAIQGMENSGQLEMQIQLKDQGDPNIQNEGLAELSKITNYDGLVQSDMAAAQLIYSALSAISQNSQADNSQVVAGVENGDIQTSIETDSSQGVTTHTITFHLPESEELSGQQQPIQGQVQKDSDGLTVIQVDGNVPWQVQPGIDLENV